MNDIPQNSPTVVLNCFDTEMEAYKFAGQLEDLFEQWGTRSDIYISRGKKNDGWLVYICSFKLQKKYIGDEVIKIKTGEQDETVSDHI